MKHIGAEDLDNLFTYHPPVGNQVADYQAIRDAGKAFAAVICERVPAGPDRDDAIRQVRGAVMWANAAVACSPTTEDPAMPTGWREVGWATQEGVGWASSPLPPGATTTHNDGEPERLRPPGESL